MGLFHHISLGVTDVGRAARCYDPVLGTLGTARAFELAGVSIAYGTPGGELFFIGSPIDEVEATVGNGTHICFNATDRAAVDAFYETALAHGGIDDGPPGTRTEYDEQGRYYAAFVRDPDGNKIEALCFG